MVSRGSIGPYHPSAGYPGRKKFAPPLPLSDTPTPHGEKEAAGIIPVLLFRSGQNHHYML
ncbi:MAG: hypothetical protein PHW22_04315 [Bacilli bacterium]|nr:hypothetical protein [Bacilli bacterium]